MKKACEVGPCPGPLNCYAASKCVFHAPEPEKCPECGHGNRLNGRIVHGPKCSTAARHEGESK
jgi:hypothetical protein